MEVPLCLFIRYGGRSHQTTSCGPTEVKVRTAFVRVGERNFEPVQLPDRENGNFGFFRTERFTYDRQHGVTESGRVYLANVHNIWEKAYETNEDGSFKLDEKAGEILIPLERRVPKPIVYHLNAEFPCELISTAQKVAESWSNGYRRVVAVAKGLLTRTTGGETVAELTGLPSTPEEAQAKGKAEWQYVPKQMFKVDLNGWVQKEPGEDWSCANLARDESKAVFRLGDLRYNGLVYVPDRQITGTAGYGPSSEDPETGEIISGVAHIYSDAMNEQAGSALDIVRMLNNDLTIKDLQSGDYVKAYIEKNRPMIHPAKMPKEVRELRGPAIKDLFLTKNMKAKLALVKTQGLEKAMGSGNHRRLQTIRGTPLEDYLLNEEVIKGASPFLLEGEEVGPGDLLTRQQRDTLSRSTGALPTRGPSKPSGSAGQ